MGITGRMFAYKAEQIYPKSSMGWKVELLLDHDSNIMMSCDSWTAANKAIFCPPDFQNAGTMFLNGATLEEYVLISTISETPPNLPGEAGGIIPVASFRCIITVMLSGGI